MQPSTVPASRIISFVESTDNPYAIRFEPVTYASTLAHASDPARARILSSIAHANRCSQATAEALYSTSFGAYQIMGFNLYGGIGASLIYAKTVAEFLASPADQVSWFDLFCKQKGIDYTSDDLLDPKKREHFGAVYNGNPDAYAAMIVIAMRHLGFNL